MIRNILKTALRSNGRPVLFGALGSENNAEVTLHNYGSRASFSVIDILEAMAKEVTADAFLWFVYAVVHRIPSYFA